MIHGINNSFLYAATSLMVTFQSPDMKMRIIKKGTGFFIEKEGELYLITNRHMVDIGYDKDDISNYPGYTLSCIKFDTRTFDKVQCKVHVENYIAKNYLCEYPLGKEDDIACLYQIEIEGSKATSPTLIKYDMLATAEYINKKLSVCDFVAFVGFSDKVWDVHNNMPILRSGVIASDPRLDYNNTPNYGGHIIAYEAFSTGGASGSPVFAMQKGFKVGDGLEAGPDFYRETKLIGINGYHFGIPVKDKDGNEISHQHQHISLMYKADQIRALIDHCEAMQIVTAPTNII